MSCINIPTLYSILLMPTMPTSNINIFIIEFIFEEKYIR